MKNFLFLIFLLLAVSIAGHTFDQENNLDLISIRVEGTERSFEVLVPPRIPSEDLSAVIVLHGAGDTSLHMYQETELFKVLREKNLFGFFPQGTEPPVGDDHNRLWNAGDCCLHEGVYPNDVQFIRSMMETSRKLYDQDFKQVYIFGYSNGSLLAFRLACELPGDFSGILSISGGVDEWKDCKQMEPPPVVAIVTDFVNSEESVSLGGGTWQSCAVPSAFLETEVEVIVAGVQEQGIKRERFCPYGNKVLQYHIPLNVHAWPPVSFKIPNELSGDMTSIYEEALEFFEAGNS